MALCFGVDLGGTKVEGVVIDSEQWLKPICRKRVATEGHKGYQHSLQQIATLVAELQKEAGCKAAAVGFGTPGVLDPQTQLMKNANSTALNGKPLKADLQRQLGIPVKLANDANCFALAEALWGAGRNIETVFGVIMGTGVGGGVVVDGKVLYGCQGIAGEWGHNILVPGGTSCYCEKQGCVETYLSGPALERRYRELAGEDIPVSLAEIAARARSKSDQNASTVIDELIENFGKALAVVINIFDPQVVVLGGGVSNVEEIYTRGVDAVRRNVFNDRLETAILKNELGDSAGVFGAALLVK